MTCPSCAYENPEGMRFCGQCGTSLEGGASAVREAAVLPAAERRHLTVMFCDLVGSTELTQRVDPEEFRDLIRKYQRVCEEGVREYGGYVAQYQGDGVVIYFGYPRAQEDDPKWAVLSALEIVEDMKRLSAELEDELSLPLGVRIGIEAGYVVTGEVGTGELVEATALGAAPNVAARLQSLAAPFTVLVGPAVYRLTQGYVAYQPLGDVALRGIDEPVSAYRAMRPTGARSRFEVALSRGLTPLVGRSQELAQLLDRFERARAGHAGVVVIEGEAGIGKSRLLQVLRERTPDAVWFANGCSPMYTRRALSPIIEMLRRNFRLDDPDAIGGALDRLERGLGRLGVEGEEATPLLAALLSVPVGDRFPALNLSPERQKERTFELLLSMLRRRSKEKPVVFAMEDLHWADPTTLELLDRVVAECVASRLFVVLTTRPTYRHPWTDRDEVIDVVLDRLDSDQVTSLVQAVAGGIPLPPEVLAEIAGRTEGVPLFVEEFTKTVLDSGALRAAEGAYELAGPLENLSIPETLQDSLMARLDRLETVKVVAQVGAVLGREFPRSLLEAVLPTGHGHLDEDLERLVDSELLHVRSSGPESTYVFNHALVQDAAYASLLKKARRTLHERAATALEQRAEEGVEVAYELLAHHFEQAGRTAGAVKYLQFAGDRAIQSSALTEAADHLGRALALLEELPDSVDRQRTELALRISYGTALIATRGYAAPEVEQAFTRARELSEGLGDVSDQTPVLLGLWAFYTNSARYSIALDLGRRAMEVAEVSGDVDAIMDAHFCMGNDLHMLGELEDAAEHLQAGVQLDPAGRPRSQAPVTGTDPGVANRVWLGETLWILGHPDEAARWVEEGLELARSLAHAYSMGHAFVMATWVHYYRGDWERTQELASEAVAMSAEKGFPYIGLLTTFLLQITRVRALDPTTEAEELENALAGMTTAYETIFASGARFGVSQIFSAAIQTYLDLERWAEARTLLEQAFEGAAQTGEGYFRAEHLRQRAVLHRADEATDSGARERAETDLRDAIVIANGQGSRSFELRSAMDLAELLEDSGQGPEGLAVLGPVFDAFDQGHATADLQHAADVLERLR